LKLAAARHAEFEALEEMVERAQQALEDRKARRRAKGLLMSASTFPRSTLQSPPDDRA